MHFKTFLSIILLLFVTASTSGQLWHPSSMMLDSAHLANHLLAKKIFQKHGIYIDPAHPFPLETDLQLRTALHHRAARNAHEIAGFLCLGLAVASFSAIQHCSPDQFECYAPVANILVVSAGVGLTGDAVYFLIHSRTHHRLMKQRLALVKNGY